MRYLANKLTTIHHTLFLPFYKSQVKASERGMSMIEMIIVMSLIAGLTVVVVGSVMDGARTARISETEIAFGTIKNSLMMYKLHVKKYPTTDQGLSALVSNTGDIKGWRGPYIEEGVLNDAWGMPLIYESDGRHFTIASAGPDEEAGTEDDISFPKRETIAAGH